MANKINLKVYTYWTKNGDPEVRRLVLEKNLLSRFCHLECMLQDAYPGLRMKTYSVAWKDEDGDEITVSSDADMRAALGMWRSNDIRLYVHCKSEQDKNDNLTVSTSNQNPGTLVVHPNVICDVCEERVVGFRYKCGVCDDYDLCSRCEAAGHHPHHSMMRISRPGMLPRAARQGMSSLLLLNRMQEQQVARRSVESSSSQLQVRVGMPMLDFQLGYQTQERRLTEE